MVASDECVRQDQKIIEPLRGERGIVQTFVFSYLCQSCKRIPEVFLVRREGSKLTLSGRAPIEHVDVPKEIPKTVAAFYSGAIVAHQSGQTLAGNFLLRTLIERTARANSPDASTADEAIERYMNALPEDFKKRFPSLRDLYSTLSDDIHAARGSPEVFERTREDLVTHFKALSLFAKADKRRSGSVAPEKP